MAWQPSSSNKNSNNDFITIYSLKGGSSSVKFTLILKIITIVILIMYNVRDATTKVKIIKIIY